MSVDGWMDGWGPCKKEEILYQLVHNVGKLSGKSEMPAIVELPYLNYQVHVPTYLQ